MVRSALSYPAFCFSPMCSVAALAASPATTTMGRATGASNMSGKEYLLAFFAAGIKGARTGGSGGLTSDRSLMACSALVASPRLTWQRARPRCAAA